MTLTFYIRIYAGNCYKQFLIKIFLANSVFKFLLVHLDEKLYKVVIIFFTTLIWKLPHYKMYLKTHCNSSSLTDKFIVEVSGNLWRDFESNEAFLNQLLNYEKR